MDIRSAPKLDIRYSLPVSALGLSNRTLGALQDEGLNFVGQLVERSERSLRRLNDFGRKSLTEVEEGLGSRGLKLNTVVAGRPENYGQFVKLLAARQQEALTQDSKGGAVTASVVAKDFRQAKIINEVVKRLGDPRYIHDLQALNRKYAGPR
jgi:Bacterial RNA polymerase, alpha chain C terminal domain